MKRHHFRLISEIKPCRFFELSSAAVFAMDCGKDAFEEDFVSDLMLLKLLEFPPIKEPSSLLCEDLFDVNELKLFSNKLLELNL